jgi:hypothetical protein
MIVDNGYELNTDDGDIEIKSEYNKDSKMFHAYSLVSASFCEFDSKLKNFCHGHAFQIDAVNDVKSKIDAFLEITPKNYEELAEAIQGSLVWTGYENCHVDATILKLIVENFIKAKQK